MKSRHFHEVERDIQSNQWYWGYHKAEASNTTSSGVSFLDSCPPIFCQLAVEGSLLCAGVRAIYF